MTLRIFRRGGERLIRSVPQAPHTISTVPPPVMAGEAGGASMLLPPVSASVATLALTVDTAVRSLECCVRFLRSIRPLALCRMRMDSHVDSRSPTRGVPGLCALPVSRSLRNQGHNRALGTYSFHKFSRPISAFGILVWSSMLSFSSLSCHHYAGPKPSCD